MLGPLELGRTCGTYCTQAPATRRASGTESEFLCLANSFENAHLGDSPINNSEGMNLGTGRITPRGL